MGTVELDDVTLAYEVIGEGTPVVLIAGCGQPAVAWHLGLAGSLAGAGYQVITFDNRGVEPSSAPPAPYTVDQMADDTLGLLDHLGLRDPVRLVGHSMGGWITEVVTERHPERVRAAAFMGSANVPTAWEIALTTVERDFARDVPNLPELYDAVEALRYLPTAQLQDSDTVTVWLSVLGGAPIWENPGRLGQFEACLAWSTGPDRTEVWKKFQVPCLVLAFEHDTDSPPARAKQAAATMPGARYVEIPGAGHLGFMTHGQETADAVIDFLASV